MGEHVARQFDEAMREHTIEMGGVRVEDDTYIQDVTIRPTRSVEYLDLNFTITPTGYTYT
jgi:hypothetical protein